MWRVMVCLIPLLGGCSPAAVRCDAHLLPINPPMQSAGAGAIAGAKTQAPAARRAP
jgi:hypothetical protein